MYEEQMKNITRAYVVRCNSSVIGYYSHKTTYDHQIGNDASYGAIFAWNKERRGEGEIFDEKTREDVFQTIECVPNVFLKALGASLEPKQILPKKGCIGCYPPPCSIFVRYLIEIWTNFGD